MTARRFFSIGGAAVVGIIAGIASYAHMRQLGIETHQGKAIASLVPLSVDGLVLVATLAIGDGRKSTFTAWAAFLIGVGVSLAANVAAADPTALARCWSAWPSAGFLLAVEVLIRGGRKGTHGTSPLPKSGAAEAIAVTAAAPLAPPAPGLDVPTDVTVKTGVPKRVPAAAKRPSSNAEKVAKAAAKLPGAGVSELARAARVSESTIRRYMPVTVPVTDAESEHVNGHSFEMEGASS